jgi:hypothetical protein
VTYLYKWMLPGMRTPTQRAKWPVAVGEWTPERTPVLCRSGWHGVEEAHVIAHLPSTIGAELWVAEARGTRVDGDDKFAAASMRLTDHVGTTTAANLHLFAADCAEDALRLVANPDPRSLKAVEVARLYAAGGASSTELAAAWDAARAAAWAAARDAAWAAARAGASAAARDAASAAARDAARSGASVAAWDAARAAARAAAWDAARAAAWDAAWAKYSNWLVVRLWEGK